MLSKLYISHKQKRTDLILEFEFGIYSGGYCYSLTYLFGRSHCFLDLSQQRKTHNTALPLLSFNYVSSSSY